MPFANLRKVGALRSLNRFKSQRERGKFERPRRFERLVFRALAEDMISPMKAAELLRLSLAKIEEGLRGPGISAIDSSRSRK